MADKPEHIVPVRLEIDHESIKFRDTLLWNCADTVVDPGMFAHCLCEDFGFPPNVFVPKIVSAIQERVREYQSQLLPIGPHRILGGASEFTGQGKCDPEEVEWWARQVKRRRLNTSCDASDRPMTVKELAAEPEELDEELRIHIKLDILIGQVNLVDTFEWDLYSEVTPERFAATYAADLGLGGDFKTAVAHDIHEQVQVYLRSLFLVGHPFDGTAIQDDDIRMAFLPPVTDVVRKDELASGKYTPFLSHLTDVEMDKIEKDREKDLKRKRRQTRGRRGIILPDREPVKTNRTLLKSTVGVLDTQPAPREAQQVVAPQPTSRRAAAIAATAYITNMAKEDDMIIPDAPSPPMSSRSRRAAPLPFAHHALTPMRNDTPDRGYMTPDGMKEDGYRTPQQMMPVEVHKNCLNCGVPDHLSGGMKKGPAGFASLCNQCSRYYARWKRHRKIEPEEPVPIKVDPSQSISRASPAAPAVDDDDDDYHGAQNGHAGRARSAGRRKIVQDSPPSSPKSTMSYISETSTVAPPLPPSPKPEPTPERKPVSKPKSQPTPPAWLSAVTDQVRQRFPYDHVEIVCKAKPGQETDAASDWRLKCLDCPGKIYATGPEQTLSNFEVHLKNRAHRTKVAERTGGKAPMAS